MFIDIQSSNENTIQLRSSVLLIEKCCGDDGRISTLKELNIYRKTNPSETQKPTKNFRSFQNFGSLIIFIEN